MTSNSESASHPFPSGQLEGLSYSEDQLKLFQDHYLRHVVRNIGWYTQVIAEIREIAHGMIILELSYPYDLEVSENDKMAYVQQLFLDPLAPDFWEISYLHLVEYKTTGPGGYVGFCGTIIYDQTKDELKPGEAPSFNRYHHTDRLLTTEDLYYIIHEMEISYF